MSFLKSRSVFVRRENDNVTEKSAIGRIDTPSASLSALTLLFLMPSSKTL